MRRDINLCAAKHGFQRRVVQRPTALETWKHELRHAGLIQLDKD